MNAEEISAADMASRGADPLPAQDEDGLDLALPTSEGVDWPRRSGRVRVTRACDRCKKRKVRCNGQGPCNVCTEASATCSYNASYTRGRRPNARVHRLGPPAQLAADSRTLQNTASPVSGFDGRISVATTPTDLRVIEPPGPSVARGGSVLVGEPVSRTSPEPTQTDLEGYYVGPSSGISFLSRVQKRFQESVSFPRGLSVFNFGDSPLPYCDNCSSCGDTAQPYLDPTFFFLLSREDTTRLIQRYFDFAVPVDRFMHRPTVERWLDEFYETQGTMKDKDAAPAKTAVLFMIFAIAQEHMVAKLSPSGVEISVRYFRAATHQLSREQGAVRLASVQARLCQCLWLLSQSRINHCWSLFGTVARLAIALGLHRNRHSSSDSMTRLEIECRRRTFWSAYSLDNYLSMALGRPRTFNDKDIDQELPDSVDDDDIDNVMENCNFSPTRGLSVMSGPVAYAKLSRTLSGILSDVYSIHSMTITQHFSHISKYMEELKAWRFKMSNFLDQHCSNAAPLILIYQRQRNVLNLAYWHTVILTNRPLLLKNFARLTSSTRRWGVDQNERQAQIDESILECLKAAMEIVGIVDALMQAKQLFRAFWFTPYFAFSASVILYVYTIQHSKEQDDVYRLYFAAAERCQQQIVDIAEEGTLTARYCLVLEELRAEAARQTAPAQASHEALAPIHSTMDTRNEGSDFLASNTQGLAGPGFGMEVPELTGLDQFVNFHVSPSGSLEDLTSWVQFDSMVRYSARL
ncbi:fungal-specific transcription factor domain-containing protein [Dactylonectria macrodidyma]|uniref:Fungal-specific transcription factor domain-containing protein n=1 Tax=Dactylonectria macrodidyma TaxID=307937 RepID=A0A9P9J856_9HYPO|nr:fungal-specific transcription factor domain-containing protein [Dactylonectria macrodidyma]